MHGEQSKGSEQATAAQDLADAAPQVLWLAAFAMVAAFAVGGLTDPYGCAIGRDVRAVEYLNERLIDTAMADAHDGAEA